MPTTNFINKSDKKENKIKKWFIQEGLLYFKAGSLAEKKLNKKKEIEECLFRTSILVEFKPSEKVKKTKFKIC